MSRNKIILLIGILLAAMPFLGFPSAWKDIFYVAFGVILIILAIIGHVRRRSPRLEEQQEVITEVYVQEGRQQV